MIINVRTHNNRTNIIVSYLSKNEEKDGYSSFYSKKFIIKGQSRAFRSKLLTLIKTILNSKNNKSAIDVNTFVNLFDDTFTEKNHITTLKQMTETINASREYSSTASLSQLYFNNKIIPKIKFIHTINDNTYFMVKIHTNKKAAYNLELIENENVKCTIPVNNLINLYRKLKTFNHAKQKTKKIIRMPFTEHIREVWRNRPLAPDERNRALSGAERRTYENRNRTGGIEVPTAVRNEMTEAERRAYRNGDSVRGDEMAEDVREIERRAYGSEYSIRDINEVPPPVCNEVTEDIRNNEIGRYVYNNENEQEVEATNENRPEREEVISETIPEREVETIQVISETIPEREVVTRNSETRSIRENGTEGIEDFSNYYVFR